jgi:hypothetical protein
MRELSLGELPSAGEPLQLHIDENNAELLESDVQQRIKRQQSRLTRKQQRKLTKRLTALSKQLNSLSYNQLIYKRWEYEQLDEQLTHLFKTQPDQPPKTIAKRDRVTNRIANLTAQIDSLQPLSDEFDTVNNALKNHYELMAWEAEDKENFEAFKREARTWEAQLASAFKQSPRLHHKGVDAKGKPFIKIPIIEDIVIKDDRVMFRIKTTGQTAIERLFNRWHSALPYGVDVSALVSEETLENLSTACNRVVTVERSKRGTNLFYVISRLDAPDGIPKSVLYQKVIDWYPTKDHINTPWASGVTNDRQVHWYNFEDNPHVLIAGASNGGKSNHVNQMIATMVTMNTPDELRIMLVDLKGGIEFTHWTGLQHQLRDMLTTPNQVLDGLSWLRTIMERRLQAFEKIKAKNLTTYNRKAKTKLPRLVCIVDEMATLIGLSDLTKDLHTELRVLSAQGRAVGISLVLCTQHPSVDVLPGWVKTNMSLRVSARMPSMTASMIVLDSPTASKLPDIVGRMVFSSGRNEFIAQSPYISDEQIVQAIKVANEYPAPDNTEFLEDVKEIVLQPILFNRDDMLEIALTRLDGKISPSRIHKIVSNKRASLRELRILGKELVKNIKDDGGIHVNDIFYDIKKVGNTYQLIEAEDQTPPTEHPTEQKTPETLIDTERSVVQSFSHTENANRNQSA